MLSGLTKYTAINFSHKTERSDQVRAQCLRKKLISRVYKVLQFQKVQFDSEKKLGVTGGSALCIMSVQHRDKTRPNSLDHTGNSDTLLGENYKEKMNK